ncbi:MAG: exodeoxyribonuclease III [Xanthomonadales bacterium]|nr:exodeoxyribonuclease III [Xanthomonadales bacterium]
MRVITINVNGIRAAARKGLFDWLAGQDADVVCIQETKAQEHQLTDPVFRPEGYHCYYHDAEKKGYSGTALYSRREPDEVKLGIGWDIMDRDGRWLQADFGDLSVVSLYLHSGSSSEERQQLKFQAMDYLQPRLQAMAREERDYLVCGDWNIAHRKIDLKNWRGNQKNSGFLPEEREWMGQVFGEVGWVDVFRTIEPGEEHYTWWSNRGRAWDNNTGWRIDYHVGTPGIANKARRVEIYKDERFSDHAPLIIDYDHRF